MARKKMRHGRFDLMPQERKTAETPLTPQIVHAWLEQAIAGDRSITARPADSSEVFVLAKILLLTREMVTRQRQSWAPSARNFERFADLCRGVIEILPSLKAEVVDALQLTNHNPPDITDSTPQESEWLIRDWFAGLQLQPQLGEALNLLDALDQIMQAMGHNPTLTPGDPPADDWRVYAEAIRPRFNRAVVRTGARSEQAIGNPWYAFVVLYSPYVTGEHVKFSAVRNHYTRRRPIDSRQRRHWYREHDAC